MRNAIRLLFLSIFIVIVLSGCMKTPESSAKIPTLPEKTEYQRERRTDSQGLRRKQKRRSRRIDREIRRGCNRRRNEK